jgi:hypothetical protein
MIDYLYLLLELSYLLIGTSYSLFILLIYFACKKLEIPFLLCILIDLSFAFVKVCFAVSLKAHISIHNYNHK